MPIYTRSGEKIKEKIGKAKNKLKLDFKNRRKGKMKRKRERIYNGLTEHN